MVGRITDQGEPAVVTLSKAPRLELLGAEQLGEERHGRCEPQGSGFMVLGLADRVSGGAAAMAESTPLGPLRGAWITMNCMASG